MPPNLRRFVMRPRGFIPLLCLLLVGAAGWLGTAGPGARPPNAWVEVSPGLWRTPQPPFGYALVEGDAALLIDAPHPADGLRPAGVRKVEQVLLTHHHRDACAQAAALVVQGIPVRASKAAAEWLKPDA